MSQFKLVGNVTFVEHSRSNGKKPFTRIFIAENHNGYRTNHSIVAFGEVSEAIESAGIAVTSFIRVVSYNYRCDINPKDGKPYVEFVAFDVHTPQGTNGIRTKGPFETVVPGRVKAENPFEDEEVVGK